MRQGTRAARAQARAARTAAVVARTRRTAWSFERTLYRLAAVVGFVYAAWSIYQPAAFVVGAAAAMYLEQMRSNERGE